MRHLIRAILAIAGNRRFWTIVLILSVAVLAACLYHDFYLDVTTKIEKLPDMSISNVKLDKKINNRHWKFDSPEVQVKDNVLYTDNIRVDIAEKNGQTSTINAKHGVVSKNKKNVTLTGVDGFLASDGRRLMLQAETAEYDAKQDSWHLSDNLNISNNKFKITADKAVFENKTGTCRINGRGKITWRK